MISDHICAITNKVVLPPEEGFKHGNSFHLEYIVVMLSWHEFLGHKYHGSPGLPIRSLSVDSTCCSCICVTDNTYQLIVRWVYGRAYYKHITHLSLNIIDAWVS